MESREKDRLDFYRKHCENMQEVLHILWRTSEQQQAHIEQQDEQMQQWANKCRQLRKENDDLRGVTRGQITGGTLTVPVVDKDKKLSRMYDALIERDYNKLHNLLCEDHHEVTATAMAGSMWDMLISREFQEEDEVREGSKNGRQGDSGVWK